MLCLQIYFFLRTILSGIIAFEVRRTQPKLNPGEAWELLALYRYKGVRKLRNGLACLAGVEWGGGGGIQRFSNIPRPTPSPFFTFHAGYQKIN